MIDLFNLILDKSFSSNLYFVYILKCFYPNNKILYYTGYTSDFKRRIIEHIKYPSKYIRRFKSKELVYLEIHFNSKEAKKRELYIKHLSPSKKKKIYLKKNTF